MRTPPSLFLAAIFFLAASSPGYAESNAPTGDVALGSLARSHEQIFATITGDAAVSVVLQRGDKQFVISGVTHVRAVGVAAEITVKNGRKYSIGAADILFITNDTFGLK